MYQNGESVQFISEEAERLYGIGRTYSDRNKIEYTYVMDYTFNNEFVVINCTVQGQPVSWVVNREHLMPPSGGINYILLEE